MARPLMSLFSYRTYALSARWCLPLTLVWSIRWPVTGFEFNDAQYGPYPAKVSANRVTDENAAVQAVAAHSPLLTTPNEIGEAAWKNWVQERGTYFLAADKDSRYRDVLQMEDNFPYNKGVKTGALVEANYGKGRWVYVGLGLWRQLPSGTDGAYQLLANLISLGRASR